MDNGKERIRTRVEVKVELKRFAEEREEFATQEAADMVRQKVGVMYINNNRIAQYLRGIGGYEFHPGLKKWVKTK
jgi:hypothetical protein